MRAVKPWNRLPRAVVELAHLEGFKRYVEPFMKNSILMGKNHIGEVPGGLLLMRGTPAGAGEECEETTCDELTTSPISISLCCWEGRGRVNWR